MMFVKEGEVACLEQGDETSPPRVKRRATHLDESCIHVHIAHTYAPSMPLNPRPRSPSPMASGDAAAPSAAVVPAKPHRKHSAGSVRPFKPSSEATSRKEFERAQRREFAARRAAKRKEALKAGLARPKRSKAKAGRALDFSPLAPPNADIPVFQVDNATAFSEADMALFDRAAGADATTLKATPSLPENVVNGDFDVHNAEIDWGANGDDSSFSIEVDLYSGPSLRYESGGSEAYIDGPSEEDYCIATKVQFVPLSRNSAGVVNVFRIDVYKRSGEDCPALLDSEDPTSRVFKTESIALKVLVSERIVGGKWFENVFRVWQSPDELALSTYNLVDDDYPIGHLEVTYYDNSIFPSMSIGDLIKKDVIYVDTEDETLPSAFMDSSDLPLTDFDLDDNGTNGLVYTLRVPVSFEQLVTPPHTLGTSLPVWIMVVIFASLIVALLALMRRK
jgi:hypothetical protein